jgi:hypothetical protein
VLDVKGWVFGGSFALHFGSFGVPCVSAMTSRGIEEDLSINFTFKLLIAV